MQTNGASSQTSTGSSVQSKESASSKSDSASAGSSTSAVPSVTSSISSTVLTPSQTSYPASSTRPDTEAPTATQPLNSSRDQLDGGVMAGVVVGAVAATLLIVLAIWMTWRKMRRSRSHKAAAGRYELQHEPSDAKLRNEYEGSDWHCAYGAPQEIADTRRQELWAEQASPKEMPVREVAELEGSGR